MISAMYLEFWERFNWLWYRFLIKADLFWGFAFFLQFCTSNRIYVIGSMVRGNGGLGNGGSGNGGSGDGGSWDGYPVCIISTSESKLKPWSTSIRILTCCPGPPLMSFSFRNLVVKSFWLVRRFAWTEVPKNNSEIQIKHINFILLIYWPLSPIWDWNP